MEQIVVTFPPTGRGARVPFVNLLPDPGQSASRCPPGGCAPRLLGRGVAAGGMSRNQITSSVLSLPAYHAENDFFACGPVASGGPRPAAHRIRFPGRGRGTGKRKGDPAAALVRAALGDSRGSVVVGDWQSRIPAHNRWR